jgi:hypothetical protein
VDRLYKGNSLYFSLVCLEKNDTSPRACSSFKISPKRSSLILATASGVSSVSGAARPAFDRDEAAFWPRWIEAMTPVAVGAPLLPELHHLAAFQALPASGAAGFSSCFAAGGR